MDNAAVIEVKDDNAFQAILEVKEDITAPAIPEIKEPTIFESDLLFRYENPLAERVPGKQSVLVLTLVRDHQSWSGTRTVADFLKVVESFEFPHANINIGILVSNKEEFESIKEEIRHRELQPSTFPKIQVLFRDLDAGISREDRKNYDLQAPRRRLLARLRNFLLFSTLREEDSVLWIDADMTAFEPNLLDRMIDSGKDIITTKTEFGRGGCDYDLNAWVGDPTRPKEEDIKKVVEGGTFYPPEHTNIKNIHHLDGEFAELDSVGGTVLFVRGEVHREGVAFATNSLIGTGWKHEGYDGIESEGLCFTARFLGYKCWAMPHTISIHSTD
ncbi:hypothetical protein BGZ81_002953 [Podila clonocystis]|nr:hypothetical protein BGZ81_002953 [Podila clonocystis]